MATFGLHEDGLFVIAELIQTCEDSVKIVDQTNYDSFVIDRYDLPLSFVEDDFVQVAFYKKITDPVTSFLISEKPEQGDWLISVNDPTEYRFYIFWVPKYTEKQSLAWSQDLVDANKNAYQEYSLVSHNGSFYRGNPLGDHTLNKPLDYEPGVAADWADMWILVDLESDPVYDTWHVFNDGYTQNMDGDEVMIAPYQFMGLVEGFLVSPYIIPESNFQYPILNEDNILFSYPSGCTACSEVCYRLTDCSGGVFSTRQNLSAYNKRTIKWYDASLETYVEHCSTVSAHRCVDLVDELIPGAITEVDCIEVIVNDSVTVLDCFEDCESCTAVIEGLPENPSTGRYVEPGFIVPDCDRNTNSNTCS